VINKILIIGYVWPEPNSSAAGSRMMQLINAFLGRGWHVTFASAASLSEHRFALPSLGVEEKIIALNCSSFDDYLAELQPDVVVFDRFFTEEQFGWRVAKSCPSAVRVLNTEDLHSLRLARHKLLKRDLNQHTKEAERYQLTAGEESQQELYAFMAADEMALREISAIYRSDLTLMISRFEMALLQEQFSVPARLLHYCPFLIDSPISAGKTFSERKDFVTIGNFRHEPNWDAVLCLKHDIWPRIRARLPQAQLKIYGAYPPPKATALHNPKQGFVVAGWADDAYAVMSSARVCLAPLRFGAGIKGKLMDAMLCATPSVTTRVGAEAMQGDLEWPGVVADDVQDFVEGAVRLYEQEEDWTCAQERIQPLLDQEFFKAQFLPALLNALELTQEHLGEHRQHNFVGAMLQHHLHKSTQYMSLWIEAKSKK
jgi:glycosyltransferase involved in cell wall biosynthesis